MRACWVNVGDAITMLRKLKDMALAHGRKAKEQILILQGERHDDAFDMLVPDRI